MRVSGLYPFGLVEDLAHMGAMELAADTLANIPRPYGDPYWANKVAWRMARAGHSDLAVAVAAMLAEGGGGRWNSEILITGFVSTDLTAFMVAVSAWEDSPLKARNLAFLAEAHHRRGEDAEASRLAGSALASLSGDFEVTPWQRVDVTRALAMVGRQEEGAALAQVVEEETRQELLDDEDGPIYLYSDAKVSLLAKVWAAAGDPARALWLVGRATDCEEGLAGFFCRVGEHFTLTSSERRDEAALAAAAEFARAGDRRSFSRVARFLRDDERVDLSMLLADRLLDGGLVADAARVVRGALDSSARQVPGQAWHARSAPALPRRLVAMGEGDLGRRLAIASDSGQNYATSFGLGHLLEQARANVASREYMASVVRGLGLFGGPRAEEAEEVLLAGVAAAAERLEDEESLIESALALAALGRSEAANLLLAGAEAIPLEERGTHRVGSRAGRIALVHALLGSEELADERLAGVLVSQQVGPMSHLSATLMRVGEAAAWYGISLGPKTKSALAGITRRFEGCGHWEEMASGLLSARICPGSGALSENSLVRFQAGGNLSITYRPGASSVDTVSLPSLEVVTRPPRADEIVQTTLVRPDDEYLGSQIGGVEGIKLFWRSGPVVLPGSETVTEWYQLGHSQNGEHTYAVVADGQIHIWGVLSPESDHEQIEPSGEAPHLIAASGPDGYLVGGKGWVDLLRPGEPPLPIFRQSAYGEGTGFFSYHHQTQALAVSTTSSLEVWREGTLVGSLKHSASTLRLQALRLPTGLIVAWSPDDRRMLVFRHGSQYLWDLENGSIGLDAMAGRAKGGAFSDDGRWLVVWADEVRIWDLPALDSTHD